MGKLTLLAILKLFVRSSSNLQDMLLEVPSCLKQRIVQIVQKITDLQKFSFRIAIEEHGRFDGDMSFCCRAMIH